MKTSVMCTQWIEMILQRKCFGKKMFSTQFSFLQEKRMINMFYRREQKLQQLDFGNVTGNAEFCNLMAIIMEEMDKNAATSICTDMVSTIPE